MRAVVTMVVVLTVSVGMSALEFEEVGLFLKGSNPSGMCWVTDDVLGLGSSFGMHFFNVGTKAHMVIGGDKYLGSGVSDERDQFCILSEGFRSIPIFYDYRTKEMYPMPEAIERWKDGRLKLKYFKTALWRYFQALIDLKRETIKLQMTGFDEELVEEEYPIEGFESWVLWKEGDAVQSKPWSLKRGENTLEGFFKEGTKGAVNYAPSGTDLRIMDIDQVTNDVIIERDMSFYRIRIRNGSAYLNSLYDRPRAERIRKYDWLVEDRRILSLGNNTILYQDPDGPGGQIFGEVAFRPLRALSDDGQVKVRLDKYLVEQSTKKFAGEINWKRTRIALACYVEEIDDFCVAVLAIIRDGVMNDSGVRMRSDPGLRGKVLGSLKKGEKVKIRDVSNDEETIEGKRAYWYKVRTTSGQEGWVFGGYVDMVD
jgi:hypothetical protein